MLLKRWRFHWWCCLVMVENMPVAVGRWSYSTRCVSINAFKGVSFGEGFKAAENQVAKFKTKFYMIMKLIYRGSNHLGGFEGGMTNGMPIIVNGVMKPIPTLYKTT